MFSFSIKWKISFSIGIVFPFWNIWKSLLVKFFEHGDFCGIFKIIDLMVFFFFLTEMVLLIVISFTFIILLFLMCPHHASH